MLIKYILKRLLIAIPTLLVISFLVFMIIQLPPGSYLDTKIEQMELEGNIDQVELNRLEKTYHINSNLFVQYIYWIMGFVRGDLGEDFETGEKVSAIIAELLPWTALLSFTTILITWLIAIPAGVLAAIEKNKPVDYVITFVGLIALATPNFIAALIFQVVFLKLDPSFDPTGLVSTKYDNVSWWDFGKLYDLVKHLLVPTFVISLSGTAGMIRLLRTNLIDELKKQYVLCSRARGLHPAKVIMKYPFRVAINPFISGIGGILPSLISGSMVISIVLGLPTLGPTLLEALMGQNTYLASSIIFIQCILAIIGILISDVLLAVVDPRIKFDSK